VKSERRRGSTAGLMKRSNNATREVKPQARAGACTERSQASFIERDGIKRQRLGDPVMARLLHAWASGMGASEGRGGIDHRQQGLSRRRFSTPARRHRGVGSVAGWDR
jgi:hypothetical protein